MKERKELAPGALTAPLPPAIVTVGGGDEINLLTVGWTGILATKPPKTYISVRPSRHSHALLKKYPEFVINLPTVPLARAVDFVGIYTGAKMNKFERAGLTPIASKVVGAPTVAECPIAIECRVTEVIPMGSHDVFMADIVSVSAGEGILDENGRLCFDRANLLAYAHGEYFALGEKVGRFGFSTDKDEKGPTRVKKTAVCAKKPSEKPIAETVPKPAANKPKTQAQKTAATAPKPAAVEQTESERTPFYKNAPKGKARPKKVPTDKDKGRPHGRRSGGK